MCMRSRVTIFTIERKATTESQGRDARATGIEVWGFKALTKTSGASSISAPSDCRTRLAESTLTFAADENPIGGGEGAWQVSCHEFSANLSHCSPLASVGSEALVTAPLRLLGTDPAPVVALKWACAGWLEANI